MDILSLLLPDSNIINRNLRRHFNRSPYQRKHLWKRQATRSLPIPSTAILAQVIIHPLSWLQRSLPPTNCPKLCRVSKLNLRFLPCREVLLHHIQLSYTPSLLVPRFSSKCPLFLKPSKETVQDLPWTSFLPAPPSVYILFPKIFHPASEPSVLEMPPPPQVQLLGTGIFSPYLTA